jgi:hypothetical protein
VMEVVMVVLFMVKVMMVCFALCSTTLKNTDAKTVVPINNFHLLEEYHLLGYGAV